MFRIPLRYLANKFPSLRKKPPQNPLKKPSQSLKEQLEEEVFQQSSESKQISTGSNLLVIPTLLIAFQAWNSEYLEEKLYKNTRLLALWSSSCNSLIFGMIGGIKILNFVPGSHNILWALCIPANFACVYAACEESWRAYCAGTMANSLFVAYAFIMARNGSMPIWIMPSLLNFLMANFSFSLLIILNFFGKESYCSKMKDLLEKIENGKYKPSDNLKP
ncbi:hypothetical protein SteCoe_28269 [Stentor coeruleus]|uniref:Uncharacterized protein n=1 Tax=Stentor coeruleus TaxID=5963 RepID=A0A1R2B8K8_9CILI|nr:hypothetical protein SteCoe_28269 [Stentor coeruleus]